MNAELVTIEETKQETKVRVQIYYWNRQHIDFLMNTTGIAIENLNETHVKVPTSRPRFVCIGYDPMLDIHNMLEDLFCKYNHEDKNPLGSVNGQKFVRENKTHTSMSVGDVIQINEKYFVCKDEGWRELEKQK